MNTKKILFQGDSITDAGRERDWVYSWGKSYPFLIEAELGYEKPAEYEYINRGISGNRSVDLYARIKEDIIFLRPDYISFLIGVNDVLHGLSRGVDADKYEKIYTMMIEEIKEALPAFELAMLDKGYHVAYIQNATRWHDVSDDEMKDAFCEFLHQEFSFD